MKETVTYLDKNNNRTSKDNAWTVMTQVYNDAGNLQRTGYTVGAAQLKVKQAQNSSTARSLIMAETGKREVLSKNIFKIGRDKKCDIIPETSDKKIDKIHAMLELRQGQWYITDFSKTGVLVNGTKIMPGKPFELVPGSEISLAGKISYFFE